MLTRNRFLVVPVLLVIIGGLCGQESKKVNFEYPAGLAIEYGMGYFAVTDEYISGAKYSGTLPYVAVNWSRIHETYGYRMEFLYRSSSDIKNYNVSAEIIESALNYSYMYPLSEKTIFGKKMFLFWGPASEFYVYYNKPNIAVSGFDYAQSFAALLSLGGSVETFVPLNDNLRVEGTLKLALLSLGLRMVDSEEEDVSPAKLLTVFAGTHGSFRLGFRYRLFSNLSVRAVYGLELTRIRAWNPLLAVSDNVIATLSYEY